MKLGTAFGIDVLLHWTFFLLPVLVTGLSLFQGDSFSQAALWLVSLLAILASVLIHELGHSLAARKLGIPIVDIILTPICGLARLQRPPKTPTGEIMVAVAGPCANAAFAGLIGLLFLCGLSRLSMDPQAIRSSLLLTLFWINVALSVLNLLPVFPMDGGRILRALLAIWIDGSVATLMSARIGQVLAIGLVVAGFFISFPPLVFVGFFLLLTAEREIRMLPNRI